MIPSLSGFKCIGKALLLYTNTSRTTSLGMRGWLVCLFKDALENNLREALSEDGREDANPRSLPDKLLIK